MNGSIVFLDAATIDYGDIDLSALEGLGHFTAFDATPPSLVAERLRDASVAITNKTAVTEEVVARCPSLRLIAVAATGYDVIDLPAASRREIAVVNVPGYATPTVAQFTIAYILACATRLVEYSAASRDGSWSASPSFTLGTWPTMDVRGKVLGIMGLGAIGREVARLARAFGMRVIALCREGVVYRDRVERAGFFDLAHRSDFVSVHLPLNAMTRHLIGRDFLARMKKSAFLINMARGAIVDPAALNEALRDGRIAGAAIDVMEKEPPDRDDPLLGAPNLIITPHVSWASVESRRRLVDEVVENIRAFMQGGRRNRVK